MRNEYDDVQHKGEGERREKGRKWKERKKNKSAIEKKGGTEGNVLQMDL